jgi:hypothetical protein
MTTSFSQRDPRWAGEMLGTCRELTIGQAGCLVSCVASLLVDWEVPTDPGRLNRWLRSHGGYADGCQFAWRSVGGLGAELRGLVACHRTPAPMERIAQELAAGNAVIAMVDAQPGGELQQHWVRVLNLTPRPPLLPGEGERLDCEIMDPWRRPGEEVGSLVERYGAKGWDAARIILEVAFYARDGRSRIAFTAAEDEGQPATVCLRGGA